MKFDGQFIGNWLTVKVVNMIINLFDIKSNLFKICYKP
jgi:hypothetical protein